MSKKQVKQAKQASKKRYSAIPSKRKAVKEGAVATMEAPTEAVVVEAKPVEVEPVEAKPVVKEVAASVSTIPSEACLTAINELRNLNADTACEAASVLGALGEAFAVSSLMQVVVNGDGYFHPVVRAAAAESLGKLKDARSLDALVIATRDTMAEASAEAIRALSMIGDARAIEPLVQVVRNSDGYFVPVVRRAAVIALAKLGGATATEALRRVAEDASEDPVIRDSAAAK